MTTSFRLTAVQFFEKLEGHPAPLFLDRSLKVFRLLTEPLDVYEHVLGRTRGGR
jgi:hypothetical protein